MFSSMERKKLIEHWCMDLLEYFNIRKSKIDDIGKVLARIALLSSRFNFVMTLNYTSDKPAGIV